MGQAVRAGVCEYSSRYGELAVEAMLLQLRDAWQIFCVDGYSDDGPQPKGAT